MWTTGIVQVGLCPVGWRKDNGTNIVEDICKRVVKMLDLN